MLKNSLFTSFIRPSLGLLLLSSFTLVACFNKNTSDIPKVIAKGAKISYKDIPKGYYIDQEKNHKVDPSNDIFQAFRDRKKTDLNNSEAPKPFLSDKNQPPKRFEASKNDWTDLGEVFKFDWAELEKINPVGVEELKAVVKTKIVLNHADFKIVELAIGAEGILPYHTQAAPAALHILGGSGVLTIDGKRVNIHTGTSIKLAPFTKRGIEVNGTQPLKALLFIWAPNGRQDYLSYGYYMTGCNFHAQPIEAKMPTNFEIWEEGVRKKSSIKESIVMSFPKSKFFNKQTTSLASLRNDMGDKIPNYATTALLSNELDISWLDFTKIKGGGFFWAKDAERAKDLLAAWNNIARMKGVFQAKSGNSYDFNISYIALGPHGKYVTHSHATPEFYYVLGGETEWILEGENFVGKAGDLFFHSPYWNHEMLPLKSGQPLRAVTGSWAPFGDREVFDQPTLLFQELPKQVKEAVIGDDFNFHDFKLKTGLVFEGF